MSRWRCPSCKEMHSTTGTPNHIQGYWLSDEVIETTCPRRDPSGEDLGCVPEWVWENGIPANRCPSCKTITSLEAEDEG